MKHDILREKISKLDPAQYRMVSPAQMSATLGVDDTPEFAAVLESLSQGADACLERWAIIFDDIGEHPIKPEDLAHFDETGEIVHPETGELIPEARTEVDIFYAVREPSPEAPAP